MCSLTFFSFADIPPKPSDFSIHHIGGKCVSINMNGHLYLTALCTTRFSITSNKSLKHVASGKCVIPESYYNGAILRLETNCDNANTRFEQTMMNSTKHVLSGKCWHPSGGSNLPKEGTEVVIWSGCDKTKSIFKFEAGE